jgi:N-acetylmuramoyl-L-alanine amidase
MKESLMAKYSAALGAFMLALMLLVHPLSTTANSPLAGKRIVLDPGHGGSDTGTTECFKQRSGVLEKEATLDIGLILRDMLAKDGAIVTMTRETDETLSNNDRYTTANNANGQALVSIHLNGSTDYSINRTLALWGQRNKDLKFTQTIYEQQKKLGIPEEGIRQFASGVLVKAKMPAMMSESVYLSNTRECELLSDGTMTRQRQIAQVLYDGLNNWFVQNP